MRHKSLSQEAIALPRGESAVWKAIKTALPLVTENLKHEVGTGDSMLIWSDSWMKEGTPSTQDSLDWVCFHC